MEATEVRKLAALEDKHWWYAERRQLLARQLQGIAPGRALDIGAAGGGNTRVLRRLGWSAAALEYSVDGAVVAQGRGLAALRADAARLPFADQSMDLVMAFDVLEHIVPDAQACAEIFRTLRPGGAFLVAVPCDPRLWSAHDDAVGHVRRYTRQTLTELLAGAGFELGPMTSWNVLLRPVAAFRRRRSTGSDLEELSPIINFGLRTVITAERYLPVKSWPGISLMVTARRPANRGQ